MTSYSFNSISDTSQAFPKMPFTVPEHKIQITTTTVITPHPPPGKYTLTRWYLILIFIKKMSFISKLRIFFSIQSERRCWWWKFFLNAHSFRNVLRQGLLWSLWSLPYCSFWLCDGSLVGLCFSSLVQCFSHLRNSLKRKQCRDLNIVF